MFCYTKGEFPSRDTQKARRSLHLLGIKDSLFHLNKKDLSTLPAEIIWGAVFFRSGEPFYHQVARFYYVGMEKGAFLSESFLTLNIKFIAPELKALFN